MNRILRTLLTLALLIGVTSAASAQTQVDHTRLSTAITALSPTITLVAASGAVSGDFVYIEGELMRLGTNTTGTTWTVRRGLGEGATPARAHATTSILWTGSGEELGKQFNVNGTCTATQERFLPFINVKENRIFDCAGAGLWMERQRMSSNVESARANICPSAMLRCRDEFNQGYLVMQDDGTAKSLTDTEVNFVYGSPIGGLEYREEQNKTVSSWVTIDGQLDISADDTTASEGVEILFAGGDMGTAARDQVLEIGTNGGCFTAMVTIARPDMVTQLQFGWRQNEAFQDAALYTGYTRWGTVGLTTNNGAITSSQEVSSSTTTDVSGVTWANGERRAVKACINSSGVPTAYYTAASPDNEQPLFLPITMTNSGVTQTSGTGMIPFMTFLAAGTTDAGVTIQWVELSYTP